MIKQITLHRNDQVTEDQPTEEVIEPGSKKQFVEPTISVPTDVLDATTFFQGPTIESASA